ncbi:MAG: FAD:protein FMN transferase [Planctomycetota bacterium]|nr:FAD:protein FMN transferase [Planctomycetota bacterium]
MLRRLQIGGGGEPGSRYRLDPSWVASYLTRLAKLCLVKQLGLLQLCLLKLCLLNVFFIEPSAFAQSTPGHERDAEAVRLEFSALHMGTQFRLTLYPADATIANGAVEAAFRRIGEIEDRLSDYRGDSELNQLCRQFPPGTPVTVSHDLWQVLRLSQEVATRTGGAFDISIGPLSRIWRRARRQQQFPTPQSLAEALPRTGYQRVTVAPDAPLVSLQTSDMQLDLGGVAKGFAADEARQVLRLRGVEAAMVDGGGGISLGSPPPGRVAWRIGIPEPLQSLLGGNVLKLAHQSVATSGDTQQFLELEGRRYSHIIDPRTGTALETRRMAIVVAPEGMLADALATALCVVDSDKIPAVLQQFPQVQAAVTQLDGTWPGYCTEGIGSLVASETELTGGPNGTRTETN